MGERKYKSRSPIHRPTRAMDSERDRVRRAKQKLWEQIEEELDEEATTWVMGLTDQR